MIQYLIASAFLGLLFHGIHRKVIARIQGRPGPPIWQEFLHMLKFSFKETWIPATATSVLFMAVVLLCIGIWSAALYVVISGGSLLIVFGLYLLHKIVEHGMGLSSGSPYGKFGAIRSVISAASELPLLATCGVVYLLTNTLMISGIVEWQAEHGPLLLYAFPAAAALYLIVLSKMPYSPFSNMDAKEIVSGIKTEHFGAWRAGLDLGFSIKTFVLLLVFVIVFAGMYPWWIMILLMLVLLLSLSFACALTPMLSPYDALTIQAAAIFIMAVYTVALGVWIWM